MLFGSPSHPQYMLLSEWADDGFDPNYPQYPADDMGSGEFSEEEWDSIVADNARRFAKQLALIEAGDYENVEAPGDALDLYAGWTELLEARSDYDDEEEFKADAVGTFEEYYPTLRDPGFKALG